MKRLRAAAVLTLFFGLGGAMGCSGPDSQPNVLVITLDTTRADHLSCYGYDQKTTPMIDALAADGLLFERCLSPVPVTLPSHTSIFTGLNPPTHGVRENDGFYVPDRVETLAEILTDNGWQSAAFIGSYPLSSFFNLDQGFSHYDDQFFYLEEDFMHFDPAKKLFFAERKADKVSREVISWIEKTRTDPFFIWAHFFDPHQPFDAPSPFSELFPNDPYDAEIALTDDAVGAIIARLREIGAYDNTIIVVVGDHGEGLGDHGESTHATMLYNSTLHVPLIIKPAKSHPRARRISTRVSTIDILPTVAEMLGLIVSEEVQGTSLLNVAKSGEFGSREIYHETLYGHIRYHWSSLFGLTKDGWKFVHGPNPAIYDLENDPGELVNLIGREGDRARVMLDRLNEIQGDLRVDDEAGKNSLVLDAEARVQLAALGYVGGGLSPEADSLEFVDPALPDPLRVAPLFISRISEVRAAIQGGHYDEAEALLNTIERIDPDNPELSMMRATTYHSNGKLERAEEAALRLVDQAPSSSSAFLSLGMIEADLGKMSEAHESLERATNLEPENPEPAFWRAVLLEESGLSSEAEEAYRATLELDANNQGARLNLADLVLVDGRFEEALLQYEAFIESNTFQPRAYHNRAVALTQLGKTDLARQDLMRALSLAPTRIDSQYLLALLDLREGFESDARMRLTEIIKLAPKSDTAIAAKQKLQMIDGEG